MSNGKASRCICRQTMPDLRDEGHRCTSAWCPDRAVNGIAVISPCACRPLEQSARVCSLLQPHKHLGIGLQSRSVLDAAVQIRPDSLMTRSLCAHVRAACDTLVQQRSIRDAGLRRCGHTELQVFNLVTLPPILGAMDSHPTHNDE